MRNDSIDNLRLDINKEKVRACIYVQRGDTKSRTIHLSLVNHGEIVSMEHAVCVEIMIQKPDGNETDQGMVVVGNELQYTWRTQDVNVVGESFCQVMVTFDDESILTSPKFSLMVYEKTVSKNIQKSTNEYTALTQQVALSKQYADNAKASEEGASSSAEYANVVKESIEQTKTEIATMKEELDAAELVVSENKTDTENYRNEAESAAGEAKKSEVNAKQSEQNAETKRQEAEQYVTAVNEKANEILQDVEAVKTYADNAKKSEESAYLYKDEAKASEENAKGSEQNAKESELLAKQYLEEMAEGKLVLGETSGTAYRGDRGKKAYDHSLIDGNPHKTTYAQVGADKEGAAAGAYENATAYTNQKIAELINGAPETMDTLKEIADAMTEHQSVVEALDKAIGSKANESEFSSHSNNDHIHITEDERTLWNSISELTQKVDTLMDMIGYPHSQESEV